MWELIDRDTVAEHEEARRVDGTTLGIPGQAAADGRLEILAVDERLPSLAATVKHISMSRKFLQKAVAPSVAA
jgi:hypothetical protein